MSQPSPRLLRRLAAAPLTVMAVVLAGCGAGVDASPARAGGAGDELQILTSRDVHAAPAHSPERTVLTWWRMLQYRNASDAARLFTMPVRARLEAAGFDTMVFKDLGPWATRARPHVLGVERRGTTATAFLEVEVRSAAGPNLVRRVKEPVALPLELTDGAWRIADDTFIRLQAETVRTARVKAEQAADQKRDGTMVRAG